MSNTRSRRSRFGLSSVLAAAAVSAVLVAGWPPAAAHAVRSPKKAIWGPTQMGGVLSQFPIYQRLGVRIYQMTLHWDEVAVNRPLHGTNRHDPAYRWPPDVDYAVGEAHDAGIKVALTVFGAPRWANGGQPPQYAPRRVQDLSAFLKAAANRYPTVHLWRIWDEPNRHENFEPLVPEVPGQRFGPAQRAAPRRYARMLDAAYATLKRASKSNLVIGGNTTTTGDISPLHWIRSMRLPQDRRPHLDLYGHDPFSTRPPNLDQPELGTGLADFADLDTLATWVDKYLKRSRPHLQLFVARYSVPSDHPPRGQTFSVNRQTQAQWLKDALHIAEVWPRIYAFGWSDLYDEPPTAARDESNAGLLDWQGNRKPAYFAYRDG
ncbi:MAG: polysaccharide biosynthesis protein PslG [Solirubrobacteraceae bacterium]|jgi:hypothetical protein|nr:polysaccharide biosynthesis protein PslG [Solirubrobacteraceae bacterium]